MKELSWALRVERRGFSLYLTCRASAVYMYIVFRRESVKLRDAPNCWGSCVDMLAYARLTHEVYMVVTLPSMLR